MCGYCTEIYPIEIAMEQSLGHLWDFQADEHRQKFAYYLQECHDLELALSSNLKDAQALVKLVNHLKNQTQHIHFPPLEIIFCRVVEILVHNGFSSKQYQSLISNKLIHPIVEYGVKQRAIPDKYPTLSKTFLEIQVDYEMFIVKEQWTEFLGNPSLLEMCERMLTTYIDWWHSPQDFNSKERDVSIELEIFRQIYSLVFFSLMVITKNNPNHHLIHKLLGTNPTAPPFVALELWLQRKAATILYDSEGLSAFLPYAKKVRPVLIYYLVVQNKLTKQEKDILYKAIINSGLYDEHDPKIKSPFHMFVEPRIVKHIL